MNYWNVGIVFRSTTVEENVTDDNSNNNSNYKNGDNSDDVGNGNDADTDINRVLDFDISNSYLTQNGNNENRIECLQLHDNGLLDVIYHHQ